MARQTKKWTPDEVAILTSRYPAEGPEALMGILSRTYHSIFRKANNMGLRSSYETPARITQRAKLHDLRRERAEKSPPITPEHRREMNRSWGRRSRAEHRATGRCLRCKSDRLPDSVYCLPHWASIIGTSCGHYDMAFGQKILEILARQDYRCALSGEPLIPGKNASLDHIVSKARGGPLDDLENLQWVTWDVNFGKQQLSTEEYIALCRRVVAHHDASSMPS